MKQEEALQVVKQAINLATKAGCYTMEEMEVIIVALKTLSSEQETNQTEN